MIRSIDQTRRFDQLMRRRWRGDNEVTMMMFRIRSIVWIYPKRDKEPSGFSWAVRPVTASLSLRSRVLVLYFIWIPNHRRRTRSAGGDRRRCCEPTTPSVLWHSDGAFRSLINTSSHKPGVWLSESDLNTSRPPDTSCLSLTSECYR